MPEKATTTPAKRLVRKSRHRVKFSDLNMFTRQLYTLQKAGLPMLGSLYAIRDQSGNATMEEVVDQIAKRIESGSKLSEAMENYPLVFSPVYISMVRSGEISGRLSEILDRLASLGEHDEKVQMHIKSAMRYPIIVVVSLIVGFISLILFVVPKFTDLFGRYDAALPLPTQALVLIYTMITTYWWLALILIGVAFFGTLKFVSTPFGRMTADKVILRVPVFGPLLLKISLSRFCRITSTLLTSGVPILQILDLVKDVVGNVYISSAVVNIRQSVNDGKGMLAPMRASGLFPPVVTQMVAVGEETGKLDELLTHVSDYYDSQIDYTINNLVSLIEPILILFLGGTVLFIALGIFMPMWGLMKVFK